MTPASAFPRSGEIFVNIESQLLPPDEVTTLGPAPDVTSTPPRYALRFAVHDTGIGIPEIGRNLREHRESALAARRSDDSGAGSGRDQHAAALRLALRRA